MASGQSLLLIADIGGYTSYMGAHRMSLAHAEVNTARMLEKVIDAVPDFDLIEIEGDAAFLSRTADSLNGAAPAEVTLQAAGAMHHAFHQERRYVRTNLCPCGTCTQTDNLTLKFVAHIGEVATQTIRDRTKLVGIDVIHVHRMLKNPVDIPEYVLVSEDLYRTAELQVPDQPREVEQDLEGIGHVKSYVVPVTDLPDAGTPVLEPSVLGRLGRTLAVAGTGLPYMVGLRRRRRTVGAF